MDTRENLERRLRDATTHMHISYILRDRAVDAGKQLLASSWDMRASGYDLQHVVLANQLEAQ
jgi:hypothetical protein